MRGKAVRFDRFTEGLNTQSAPYDLSDREARDARNVVATARGAIRKRRGSTSFAAPATTLKGLFAGADPSVLIGTTSSVIYGISTAGVVTSLKTGLADAPWSWLQAPSSGGQGPFYGANGTGTPQQWNGAAASTSDWTASAGSLPNAKFMVYAGNRVWAATATHVYWSNLGNPRDWPAENVAQFDPTDGENITGLGTSGPYVLVFKASKLWRIYDLDIGANQRVGLNAGTIAHRSIVETPSGTYFLSKDQGVMVTDGSSVRPVSAKVKPTVDLIVSANRSLAAGAFFDQHYYLAISTTGAANNLLLDFDIEQKAWWLHTVPVAQMAGWEPSAGQPRLYAARSDVARVDRLQVPEVWADAGTAYTSYWTGPFHTFGKPYLRKRCREIHFDGKGRVRVSVAKDFQATGPLLSDENFTADTGTFGGAGTFGGTGTFGSAAEVGEARIPTPGVGRAWSVTFGNDSAEDFEVESYTMSMQERTD